MRVVVHPFITYQLNKLSRLSLCGALLLLMAVLLSIYHSQFQQVHLVKETQALKKMASPVNINTKVPLKKVSRNHTEDDFLGKREFVNVLEFIQSAADQNKVSYNSVEYKTINISEINVISYQIDYPFTANYIDLKKFLYAVLQPYKSTLVLTNIALYRESNQVDALQGNLQFTMYLRN